MISFREPTLPFPKRETEAATPRICWRTFVSQRTSCGPGQPAPHTRPFVDAAQQEIRVRPWLSYNQGMNKEEKSAAAFFRPHDRAPGAMRPLHLTPHYTSMAEGSVLIEVGHTRVLCNAAPSYADPDPARIGAR